MPLASAAEAMYTGTAVLFGVFGVLAGMLLVLGSVYMEWKEQRDGYSYV